MIRDLAVTERPYEKALAYGVQTLSDAELLAILVRTGTRKAGALSIANQILNLHATQKGLLGLNYLTRKELTSLPGIGNTKATELLAVTELSRRMRERSFLERIRFLDTKSVGEYCLQKCRFLQTEHVFLFLLNSANELLSEVELSEGTVNMALISPREVFLTALKHDATHLILVHNHPSGVPFPSEQDKQVTRRIATLGELLDLKLLDHIIVGKNSYVSLKEKGDIFEDRS